MRVQYNFAMKKNIRDYIDVSQYTGMEVEHGSNTSNLYQVGSGSNLGHFNPNSPIASNFPDLSDNINKKFGNLRNAANV